MSESRGMMDATCSHCHARIAWYGRAIDHPPCHRCGYKPDLKDLQHDQDELDNFEQILLELHGPKISWSTLRKARVAAGLSLGQAAKLLDISKKDLVNIEDGKVEVVEPLRSRMQALYSGG